MIGKLLIGYLDTTKSSSGSDKASYLPSNMNKDGFAMPAPRVPKAAAKAAQTSTLKSQSDDDESDEEEELWDN